MLTRGLRDWGWAAQSYPAWKRLPLLPLIAMRHCTICTSWWVAAAVVAAAQPGLIPALFLVPAIVGASAALDAVVTALWRYRDKDKAYDPMVVKSNLAADAAFQKMVDEQRAKFDAEAHAKWKASLAGTPPPPPTSPAV